MYRDTHTIVKVSTYEILYRYFTLRRRVGWVS